MNEDRRQDWGNDQNKHQRRTEQCGSTVNTAFAFLADVAGLEWAIEQTLICRCSRPLDVSALHSISPEAYAGIRFSLRGGTTLIQSPYPVLGIWQANQTPDPKTIDLAEGGETLVVIREADTAEVHRLDSNTYALAECFASGLTLADANEEFCARTGFDLSASLNSLFINRCLGNFELQTGNPHAR